MTTQFMKIVDEAAWLEKRKGYITSTQIAALFGMSPYNTAFELYHITRGNIEAIHEDNNFMKFGKLIEEPVCKMIAIEHPSWVIEEFPFFAYDDEDKVGSSFDRVVDIDGKQYLLEIKSISYAEYKKKFVEHSSTDIEAPVHYEVQMQTELDLVKDEGLHGLVMAVFILDTRTLRYIFRERDAEVGKEMRASVKDFYSWTEPPKPDYARDKSIISRCCPSLDPNHQMDATENSRITELAAQYRRSKDLISQEEEAAEAASAELLTLVGTAKYVFTNNHKITLSDIKPNPGNIVTKDMVGTFIGKRNGYKKILIKATGEE